MEISITAFPRIHVTLLDTAQRTAFSPGGIGFVVAAFPLVLTASRSDDVQLRGFEYLDTFALQDIQRLTSKLRHTFGFSLDLELLSAPPQHIGLGSKTLLLSSIVAANCALTKERINVEQRQLLTGRGATSGVGLHSFFMGGLVWDGGHRTPAITAGLQPSSYSSPVSPPLLLANWKLSDWKVALIIPEGNRLNSTAERQIFHDHATFPEGHQGDLWASVFNGFLPAIVSGNEPALAKSLIAIHSVGFKAAELQAQSEEVKLMYTKFTLEGLACGLSSMGPTLYILFRSNQEDFIHAYLQGQGVAAKIADLWNEGQLIERENAQN